MTAQAGFLQFSSGLNIHVEIHSLTYHLPDLFLRAALNVSQSQGSKQKKKGDFGMPPATAAAYCTHPHTAEEEPRAQLWLLAFYLQKPEGLYREDDPRKQIPSPACWFTH